MRLVSVTSTFAATYVRLSKKDLKVMNSIDRPARRVAAGLRFRPLELDDRSAGVVYSPGLSPVGYHIDLN
jgi:hypothetical protein